MHFAQSQCNFLPVEMCQSLGSIGLKTEVFTGHISALLTGSHNKNGGCRPEEVLLQRLPGIEDLEGMFVSAICQATQSRHILFLVQLWIVAATRLGFANFLRPVMSRYDLFCNALSWSMECLPASHLFTVYWQKAERHLYLQQCRLELTKAILTARGWHLGTIRADVEYCGMHPPGECPEQSPCEEESKFRETLDLTVSEVVMSSAPPDSRSNFLIPVKC